MPALLTLDPWNETLSVQDGQPADQVCVLAAVDRIGFLLDEPDGERFIGAAVHKPFEIELGDLLDIEELWDQPRFLVPALGPEALSLGEILLLARARYSDEEPTNDALHFHAAIDAQGSEPQLALSMFKLAIEAGDLKGHFGAGYMLLELGYAAPAAEHLRIYTRQTPVNARAWCWRLRRQSLLPW